MSECPLVSVVVTTYNSAKYVLETLESVKAQTYKNIELIVSDDCSTDNTVQICREWLDENGDRFIRTELITVEKNTGISPNCKRGYGAAKGKWVKGIAGDDILFPNAIESFVNYSRQNQEAVIIVSALQYFRDTITNPFYINVHKEMNDINKQLIRHIRGSYIKSPAVFLKKSIFCELGGFNLDYPMLEDDPLWLKFLINGYKFHFIKDVLVAYRFHNNSVSNQNTHSIQNKNFYQSLSSYKANIAFPLMKKHKMYVTYFLQKWRLYIENKSILQGKKQKTSILQLRIIRLLNMIVARIFYS